MTTDERSYSGLMMLLEEGSGNKVHLMDAQGKIIDRCDK
jgi:hypothetical protein